MTLVHSRGKEETQSLQVTKSEKDGSKLKKIREIYLHYDEQVLRDEDAHQIAVSNKFMILSSNRSAAQSENES